MQIIKIVHCCFFSTKWSYSKNRKNSLRVQSSLLWHSTYHCPCAGMRYGIIKEIHPESIKGKNCIQQSSDITASYRSCPLSTFLINIHHYYLNPKLWPSCQWPCEQLYITGGTNNHKEQRKKKVLGWLEKRSWRAYTQPIISLSLFFIFPLKDGEILIPPLDFWVVIELICKAWKTSWGLSGTVCHRQCLIIQAPSLCRY